MRKLTPDLLAVLDELVAGDKGLRWTHFDPKVQRAGGWEQRGLRVAGVAPSPAGPPEDPPCTSSGSACPLCRRARARRGRALLLPPCNLPAVTSLLQVLDTIREIRLPEAVRQRLSKLCAQELSGVQNVPAYLYTLLSKRGKTAKQAAAQVRRRTWGGLKAKL